jgi:hypothetical protein
MSENWKIKLKETKKPNVNRIISWYESGLNDRYSLKDFSKPEKELYRDLLQNVFDNCKNSVFQQALFRPFIPLMKQQPNNYDLLLSSLLANYFENNNEFKCTNLNLSINDLFIYFNIFKQFDISSKTLFSSIKLNEVLNSGKYNILTSIFEDIENSNNILYDFYNNLVLSLYENYYVNFQPDSIFPDEKAFWDLYLKIISEYPFRKVKSLFTKDPLALPDEVFDSIKSYVERLPDSTEKIDVISQFLLAAKEAALNTNWLIKESMVKQFYDFLDNQIQAGKRVFKTYKFRTDFNRVLDNGEFFEDSELEEIDSCLKKNRMNFSNFVELYNMRREKSKLEIFEDTKGILCKSLVIPENLVKSSKTAEIGTSVANAAGAAAEAAAATVKTAAQQVLSATTDTTSKNAVFSSDEFVNNILPDLEIFLTFNFNLLSGKNIDEVIDFVIKADEPIISKFVEKYKDNNILKTFIKTIRAYDSQKAGCPINLQRIQIILKAYAKQQGCIIPKEKRESDKFLSIKEVNKVFPELFENSKLYKLISGNVIEGMIYINQGDEFNKFTEECRVQIIKNINFQFERCNQANFKNLSDIFKTNINILIFNISKQKYDLSEFIYSGSKEEVVFLRNGVSFYVVTIDKKLKNPVGTFNSNMKDKNLVDNVLREEIKGSSETITVQSPSGTIEVQQQPGQATTTKVKPTGEEVITGDEAEEEALEIIEAQFKNAGLSRQATSTETATTTVGSLGNEEEKNKDESILSVVYSTVKELVEALLFGKGVIPYNQNL